MKEVSWENLHSPPPPKKKPRTHESPPTSLLRDTMKGAAKFCKPTPSSSRQENEFLGGTELKRSLIKMKWKVIESRTKPES